MRKELLCTCGRKVISKVNGKYKRTRDDDHDMCFKCWNAQQNRERAKRLGEMETGNGKEI